MIQDSTPDPTPRRPRFFAWPARVTPAEKRTLVAGFLGWMLDAMDMMLYSMVLVHLMTDLGMGKGTAGLLNSLTLIASAIGGMLFGFIADRIGRRRALMISILVYSLASFGCGLAQDVVMLAFFRVVLGLGMGGEWTTGAALIAETWPKEHRGKALGLMQSSWAIGEMIAALVAGLLLPRFGWRIVFFVGVLPALLVLWIRRRVPESAVWLSRGTRQHVPLAAMLRPDIRWKAVIATAMNACAMFGYWGLFTWIPAYLGASTSEGGRGLGLLKTTAWLVLMGVGKWFGYALFGFAADAFGRRRSYFAYLIVAALLVPLYGSAESALLLLVLGPFVAFFGTGFFSGFSAVAAELFPTAIRATAMGLTYNIGRGLAAIAPFVVGAVAERFSFQAAFWMLSGCFLAAALLALLLPETRGKELE